MRLKRLLKDAEKQIPRGLSPRGMAKMKGLYGTAEAVPFHNEGK